MGEWRSKTCLFKQQGHLCGVTAVAYSPDSTLIVTGSDDNKIKVWKARSGLCIATFTENKDSVTGIAFLPSLKSAFVASSLDGTVRAFNILTFKNFRTFTSPSCSQLSFIAVV